MSRVCLALSAVGRAVGNWNDRHCRPGASGDFRRVEQSDAWKLIDRASTYLYVLGDRAS